MAWSELGRLRQDRGRDRDRGACGEIGTEIGIGIGLLTDGNQQLAASC